MMIPFFLRANRLYFACWATVYLADMRRLPDTSPDVYREFCDGNHPVKISKSTFNQVWGDQALVQTADRENKTKGGIIDFNQKPAALQRWFLTAHKAVQKIMFPVTRPTLFMTA